MKRRHYRIHYKDPSPNRRGGGGDSPWVTVLLIIAALAIIAVGAFAVVKWISARGSAL